MRTGAEDVATQRVDRGPLAVVFEVMGRLFSILVLGWAVFSGGSSPLVFLWGLWIDEVFYLLALAARQAMVRGRGASTAPLRLYFAFPAVHFVFVLFFTLIGTTGMFSAAGGELLAPPRWAVLGQVAAAFLFWAAVDVARAALRRRKGQAVEDEVAAIDEAARLALFLPHITIIAGGFCLVVFGLGRWLAWGVLVGKVLFELLSFALARQKRRPA